ncbi:ChaN family lipoprotein [Halomonas sp. BLK-85]
MLRLAPALRALWLVPLASVSGISLAATDSDQCAHPGQWWQGGQAVTANSLFEQAADQDVVLLGEYHDRMSHHRWQLHTLAGLAAHRDKMAIGLEMLPRDAQPALDAWVAGELSEAQFLQQSQWQEAWGFDPDLYLPILHFARMQQIPLLAINIKPELRRRLATEGFDAVSAEQRFNIEAPAPASDAYRQRLEQSFQMHPTSMGAEGHGNEDQEGDNAFETFLNAQLTWDAAMADGLASAVDDDTLVVGLMGVGHLAYGDGVPYQLEAMDITDTLSLMPTPLEACEPPDSQLADVLYLLGDEAAAETPPPRLGVQIAPGEDGVSIVAIREDSLAHEAGLQPDDTVTQAAGQEVRAPGELIATVQRQAPGTLLPLEILRDGSRQEILVRFPPAAPLR